MKLAIADASDEILDSNVFIQARSLVSGTVITTSLSGGGQSGAQIIVPEGTTVIDSSILSGANIGTAGGSVTYTVYSDNQCSLTVANAGTKTVTNGTVSDSDPVPFNQAGTFFWQAAYSGDANHSPGQSTCGAETVTVTQVHTTLTKTASPTSGVAPLTVTYSYHEANDGTEPLSSVAVTDDMCSPVTRGPDSPGNNDATLAPGETWTFTCTHTFTTAGTFTNTATATGNTTTGAPAPAEHASATVTVTVTSAVRARSPGYWNNHEAATTALLPQTLGSFSVGDFATATAVFASMNCSNSSNSTQNAVGCLAGHLLATKLNVANGTSTCIAPTIAVADTLLVSVAYTGPTGTYTLTDDQRATAINVKSILDAYNNTGVCT
jgi:hypothetical protein